MAGFSYIQFYGDGATDTFTLPFPYIYKQHVSATVNKIFAIMQWVTDTSVRIVPPPANGALLTIQRSSSPGTKLVTYNSGSVLTDDDLNLANTQDFYLVQEALDALPRYTEDGFLTLTPGQAQTIKDQLVQDVLNSALLADLQSNLTQVDNLAEAALQEFKRADVSINTTRELNASLGAATASITEEQILRVNADSALAADITTLTASLGTTNANVTTETAARVSGDSANATSISSVSTTVGGHTTTIASQATSINGLNAQYTMKIDANGYLAGYGLAVYPNNDGGHTSQFIILADQFAVVTPGKVPRVPFVVGAINGVSAVGISGQLIVDGSIYANTIAANTITSNKLLVNTLSSITADIGYLTTGTIRFGPPTGLRMEVTDQDSYLLWYGTGTKNNANATFYVRNDGGTKFAGSLEAASGTFAGSLSAASGTFAGSLSAATGTFSGTLTAAAVNAVDTVNIAGNAVTIPIASATGAATVTTTPTQFNSISCTTTSSQPIYIDVNITKNNYQGWPGSGTPYLFVIWACTVVLKRNGTVIKTVVNSIADYSYGFVDTPGIGSWTYTLELTATWLTSGYAASTMTLSGTSMSLLYIKR